MPLVIAYFLVTGKTTDKTSKAGSDILTKHPSYLSCVANANY